jgi:hypothetical protein
MLAARDGLTIRWPIVEPGPGKHFWDAQLLAGLRAAGAQIEFRELPQPFGTRVLLAQVVGAGTAVADEIAVDTHDSSEIVDEAAERALVYFKFQYADSGYANAKVAPGGYTLANNSAYRYLPLLRALRSLRRFSFDVYGRFGLDRGSAELRRAAVELLSSRTDFQFEGSLFRYPGGPAKMPYRRYLFELARAKVCVDLPGGGDLCTRLVDALAIGACVVGPPHRARLPVPLVDGTHVVRCLPDLSDLADVCAELVDDDEARERIGRNARDYFDRHLHRHRLGEYYLSRLAVARRARAESVPTAKL